MMDGELISRQAAIDALAEHEKTKGHNYIMFVDVVSECAEIIRDLPSAQPEQKVGKWECAKGGGYRCSECGRCALSEIDGEYIFVARRTPFCPFCGKAMIKEDGKPIH